MSALRSSCLVTNNEESKFQHINDIENIAAAFPSHDAIRKSLEEISPHGLQNLVAIIPDGAPRGKTFDLPEELEQAVTWAGDQNTNGKNVYFTVNPVKNRVSSKPNKDDIASAEYAHVDIDPDVSKSYAEGRSVLLSETVPALEAFDPTPSLIIDSGNGLGVFWRLHGATIDEAEDLNRRLIQRFGGDAGTHNIDRLMRLPGTLNYPTTKKISKGYPEQPQLSKLLWADSGVRSVKELASALPEVLPQPKAEASRVPREITRQELTTEEVREADRRLDAALARNDLLRKRWEGSTAGLQDTTRSGMDFSVTALLKIESFTRDEAAYLLTQVFEHGKGKENDERSLNRCWENSSTPAWPGVRAWINGLLSFEAAAEIIKVDAARFVGLDGYSLLLRALGTEEEVVRTAHCVALKKINENFAKTMIGGKVAIIREYMDPSFRTPTYAVMAPPQLTEWYRGISAYKVLKDRINLTNLGQDWLNWSGQRRYNAMTFAPGPVDADIYNSWTGFPIQPKEGDWSMMKRLMLEGLCAGNEGYYNWLLDWMAVGIQNPSARYGVATVLRGEKGVGKGQFAKWYGKLFGHHYLHLANAQHLVGNFNAHLERALLVFADELIWGGNKQQEGVLKALITEEMIPIERKGWDTEMRMNYTRLLVASNEDWAVPAGVGERRWFVLDVRSEFRQDTVFFSGLATQMENGGLEAMMYDLTNRKIETNQRTAPKTKALAAVAAIGLDDASSWLHDALSAGELYDPKGEIRSRPDQFIRTAEAFEALNNPAANGDRSGPVCLVGQTGQQPRWPYAVAKEALYESFEAHARERNRHGRVLSREAFFKKLKALLPSAAHERRRLNGAQVRTILLPSLAAAREEFKRTSNLDFDFDDEG